MQRPQLETLCYQCEDAARTEILLRPQEHCAVARNLARVRATKGWKRGVYATRGFLSIFRCSSHDQSHKWREEGGR